MKNLITNKQKIYKNSNEIIDTTEILFNDFGLKKLIDFDISNEDYIRFRQNHNLAKEFADDFNTSTHFLQNAIDISNGVFFEYHNYLALCTVHQKKPDKRILRDYYKYFTTDGNAIVITELLNIYDKIIKNNIKTKKQLFDDINIWYNKHKNSEIGKYNIPLFYKVIDLSIEQKILIELLTITLKNNSRYSQIYIDNKVII